jgi:putative phosphoribosyl transferase
VFTDRLDAGRRLAQSVIASGLTGDLVVLGIPRGGVPVAAQVADELQAPLDVIVVRKLGVPSQPELALGAVGEDRVRVLNEDVMHQASVGPAAVQALSEREWAEVERRATEYRAARPRESLVDRTALVIDDGVATGATARAACQIASEQGARRVVMAVPVAPLGWTRAFRDVADECIALETPTDFLAVGAHYRDFRPTTDEEVMLCLTAEAGSPSSRSVAVPVGNALLAGVISLPAVPKGLIVFAHGSGSSHRSVRNRFVAERLNEAGFATALVDLLTEQEDEDRQLVFDIGFLTGRLLRLTEWLRDQPPLKSLPVGFFGASTGAAAALAAAAVLGHEPFAVVSRGGRPDLALTALPDVTAPTLLIVGGDDTTVLGLNRRALAEFRCPADLLVVPGATHLFAESGALAAAAAAATDWFLGHVM